jgi:hypothetical protein
MFASKIIPTRPCLFIKIGHSDWPADVVGQEINTRRGKSENKGATNSRNVEKKVPKKEKDEIKVKRQEQEQQQLLPAFLIFSTLPVSFTFQSAWNETAAISPPQIPGRKLGSFQWLTPKLTNSQSVGMSREKRQVAYSLKMIFFLFFQLVKPLQNSIRLHLRSVTNTPGSSALHHRLRRYYINISPFFWINATPFFSGGGKYKKEREK